jgi:hypothetical protein
MKILEKIQVKIKNVLIRQGPQNPIISHGEEQPNNPSIPSEEDASWHDRIHT